MSTYTAEVAWQKQESETFADNRYSRKHEWRFDGGVRVPASSSPHVVRVPFSDPTAVDPEEAFVAALSSCHMLWFLSLAAQKQFVVTGYRDVAEGTMAKNAQGKAAMTRVVLRPHVTFGGERAPTRDDVDALHHAAHDACYLANSVRTDIDIEGSWAHARAVRRAARGRWRVSRIGRRAAVDKSRRRGGSPHGFARLDPCRAALLGRPGRFRPAAARRRGLRARCADARRRFATVTGPGNTAFRPPKVAAMVSVA